MTIKEASEILGKSEQCIRVAMQQGVFPWGTAEIIEGHWIYKFERMM